MMQGLLDFAKSPAGVGLLSAVAGGLAGARRGAPLNTLGAAGLAGLTGYNAASSIQEKQLARTQAEKVRQAIPAMYKRKDDGSMQFDVQGAIDSGLFTPEQIKSYAEVPNYGRAKVARTQEVMGPNGMKQIVQLDDYGQQVGGGLDGYVAPQMVDTGDRKMFVTPTAGQSFQVGMSPAEQAANARGWAGIGLRGQQNDILREQNQVMRDLNIQEKEMKLGDMRAKQIERERALEAQRASAASQLGVIDQAIKHPGRETATGLSSTTDPRNFIPGTDATNFQVLLDQIGGAAFLQGFQSLKGGGAITEIEGKKAEQAIARLNRAQSDEEFKKSLEDLREVLVTANKSLSGGARPAEQPAGGIKFLGFE
jgi:hypothetical protein